MTINTNSKTFLDRGLNPAAMTINTNSKTQPYILDLNKTFLDRGPV